MGVEECILHSHMGIGEMGIEAFYYYVVCTVVLNIQLAFHVTALPL